MARKCDTAKYRKRRERERVNHSTRIERDRAREVAWNARAVQFRLEAAERRRLDPRHQLGQRLVNILYWRLISNPLYQVAKVSQLLGGLELGELLDMSVMSDVRRGSIWPINL